MKKLIYIFLIMLTSHAGMAQSNSHDVKFVTPNSYVLSSAQDGNTLYLGGYFTGVGHNTGNHALYNQGSDIPDLSLPYINGTVYATISDSSGGWYIGGSFTVTINANTFSNLVHIKSNKTVDTVFQASTNSTVRALALSGTSLYVGGQFTTIKLITRNYLAAVNKTNGNVKTYDPNLNNAVYTLSVKDTLLIAGGAFSMAGNVTRQYLAVFNTNTGLLLKNYPSANSYVFDTHVYGSTVYAGGYLTLAGKNRIRCKNAGYFRKSQL